MNPKFLKRHILIMVGYLWGPGINNQGLFLPLCINSPFKNEITYYFYHEIKQILIDQYLQAKQKS